MSGLVAGAPGVRAANPVAGAGEPGRDPQSPEPGLGEK